MTISVQYSADIPEFIKIKKCSRNRNSKPSSNQKQIYKHCTNTNPTEFIDIITQNPKNNFAQRP